jgi:hypothetical protein
LLNTLDPAGSAAEEVACNGLRRAWNRREHGLDLGDRFARSGKLEAAEFVQAPQLRSGRWRVGTLGRVGTFAAQVLSEDRVRFTACDRHGSP